MFAWRNPFKVQIRGRGPLDFFIILFEPVDLLVRDLVLVLQNTTDP